MGKKNINPDQFKLFMGGQEWQDTVTDSVERYDDESMDDIWNGKLEEAMEPETTREHGSGVFDSIMQHGYTMRPHPDGPHLSPSEGGWIQAEGHHRIAAAAEVERVTGRHVWIPTDYRKRPHDWA